MPTSVSRLLFLSSVAYASLLAPGCVWVKHPAVGDGGAGELSSVDPVAEGDADGGARSSGDAGASLPPLEKLIGARGGVFGMPDVASVAVPKDALPDDTSLRLKSVSGDEVPVQPPLDVVGSTIEVTPHGQLFGIPVVISLHYDPSIAPKHLRVLRLDNAADPDWEPVDGVTFENGVASFESNTFSFYTVTTDNLTCYVAPTTLPCGGKCTADQYCSSAGTCVAIAQNDFCGNANVYALHNNTTAVDDAASDSIAAAFAQACGKTVTTISYADTAKLDPCTGEPLLGPGSTVLLAGGPGTQAALRFLDRRISPAYFDVGTDTMSIWTRAGTQLVQAPFSDIIGKNHDYLLIQMFSESDRGALVISTFAQEGIGTQAAAWYFTNTVLPTLKTRTWNKFLVVEWTDDGDGVPNAGDNWQLYYQDPIPPPPPPVETPWQSNVNGTLGTPSSSYYAMGYKFTPQAAGTVSALGGYFNGTKTVKLFQGSTLLASASVSSASTWAYTNITPVSLSAGVQYTVAVYLAGSGGSQRTSVATLPRTYGSIRIDTATQVSTLFNASAVPTANSSTTTMYGQADLKFQKNP